MRVYVRVIGLGIACLWVSLGALAEPLRVIRIAEPQMVGLVEANGQGAYQRLVNAALKDTGYEIMSRFFPFKRAITEFSLGRFDCLYSQTELAQSLLGPANILFSQPLSQFGFYFFTREDTFPLTSVTDLENKRLVGILGQIDYYLEHLAGAEVEGVSTESQAMGMVKLGRADVYIAALPDLLPRLSEFSVDTRYPLLLLEDRLTCHRSPENERFLKVIDQRLEQMMESGETARILGPHYFSPDSAVRATD